MPYQRAYLLDREVQSSDAATREVLLPDRGRLSAIGLRIECTNGATSGTEQLVDAIDRVEVLANGSWPIHSLIGRHEYALHSLFARRRPSQVRTMALSTAQELHLHIPFGFHLWDREHYLDLAHFKRVSLKVQFSPTISATTFTTGTFTITAVLYLMGDDVSLGGSGEFVRVVELLAVTSAASGDQLVELPLEWPHLGYLVYSRAAAVALQTDITRIRVLENVSGQEVFNARVEDLSMANHDTLQLEAIERGSALLNNAATLDTDCNFLQHAIVQVRFTNVSGTDYPYYIVRSAAGDRITMSGDLIDASSPVTVNTLDTVLRTLSWEAIGRGLPHALYVPMHEWGRPETAYPAAQRGKPRMLITQGGAGADLRVASLELARAA